MCGIAGSYSNNGIPAGMLEALKRIAHRGPDDSGYYKNENVWLGNNRLAIQDLSMLGHQPMQSADGRFTIVYNGELYNHWALRKELSAKGVLFRSASDTETLLAAFIHFGDECLQKLNGIFAFAVYDAYLEELFIARDPLGVKPLYYYEDKQHFIFSSELKSLAHLPGLDYSLNPQAFYQYLLLLYSPNEATPFSRVRKLMPGHCIRIKKGIAVQPQRYYQIPFNGHYDLSVTGEEWISATDKALNDAVSSQLISDAPVGFFLSGGLDSSLVAAIAQKQQPEQLQTCFTINTGSGFRKEGFEDDLHFARIAAKDIGAKLIEVPGAINLAKELDDMVWHLDEPQADPACLHVLHIAQAAKNEGIKVLLSGAGADDVFSGYRRHQAIRYEWLTGNIPTSIFAAVSKTALLTGNKTWARRIAKLSFAEGDKNNLRIGNHFWQTPACIRGLFLPEIANTFPSGIAYENFHRLLAEIPSEHSPLNRMLYLEMSTFLPHHNLNYTDKMSMAAGIETRVPYLDKDLIALSARIPPGLKMNGAVTKFLLREVAKNYLPQALIDRKKTGFGAPVRAMMTGILKPFVAERLLSGSLQQWNIFSPAAISQLISDNEHGKTDGAYTIFALLSIESWLRQFCTR